MTFRHTDASAVCGARVQTQGQHTEGAHGHLPVGSGGGGVGGSPVKMSNRQKKCVAHNVK